MKKFFKVFAFSYVGISVWLVGVFAYGVFQITHGLKPNACFEMVADWVLRVVGFVATI